MPTTDIDVYRNGNVIVSDNAGNEYTNKRGKESLTCDNKEQQFNSEKFKKLLAQPEVADAVKGMPGLDINVKVKRLDVTIETSTYDLPPLTQMCNALKDAGLIESAEGANNNANLPKKQKGNDGPPIS